MATKKSSKGRVSIPKYRWLMFWLLVLCSVALVCAIFGNTDVKTLTADPNKVAQDRQIRALQGELEDVQTAYSEAVEEIRVLSNHIPQHLTKLVSASQLSGDAEGDCLSESGPNGEDNFMNTTATSILIKYQDKITGVEMELPYSFEWGSECYRPDLVEKYEIATGSSVIYFGPLSREDYSWVREYSLVILDVPTSTQQRVAEIATECKKLIGEWVNDCYIKQKPSVAGIPVYERYDSGYEGPENWDWYAFGKTHTYILSLNGINKTTEAEAVRLLKSLKAIQ